MKVWIRPELAGLRASPARSMSLSRARARPHTVLSLMLSATALTASKSPGLAMGKPASITSTCIRSSALAILTFSSRVIEAPGLCSPSRNVVSKIIKLSDMLLSPLDAHYDMARHIISPPDTRMSGLVMYSILMAPVPGAEGCDYLPAQGRSCRTSRSSREAKRTHERTPA